MFRAVVFVSLTLLLAGCVAAEAARTLLPEPTNTPAPTLLPSPTIIWFPATATYTPFPTHVIVPTEDQRPGVGAVAIEDNFTDTEAWSTGQSEAGNIAFGQQELTLAVSAAQSSLISLRNSLEASDFFLEVDALPSLCLSGDSYGLMFRATSTFDTYRLLVNCNGQMRMERVRNGKTAVLQDWVTGSQIFPGGMMRSRLGVWALKDEMRVFVNGVHQFTVKDPVWQTGQVGFFARSAGDTPLTVSFSNLVISNIDQGLPVPATRTPPPASAPKATATPTP